MPYQSYLLSFCAICLFASCSNHYYYAPNTLHFPTAKEVGEATVEASLNGSQQIKGFEVKSAYCFAPRTSVMANFMYMRGSFETGSSFVFPPPPVEKHFGAGFITELGITRHFPVSEYTDFILTAGGGIGRARNNYDRGRESILNFNRIFFQPGIITKGELANIGVGLRYSRLNFHGARVNYAIGDQDLADIQKIERKGTFLIPDLGLNAGLNFNPVHINCNIVFSIYNGLGSYAFSNSNLNVSLLYDINYWTQKKQKTRKK